MSSQDQSGYGGDVVPYLTLRRVFSIFGMSLLRDTRSGAIFIKVKGQPHKRIYGKVQLYS